MLFRVTIFTLKKNPKKQIFTNSNFFVFISIKNIYIYKWCLISTFLSTRNRYVNENINTKIYIFLSLSVCQSVCLPVYLSVSQSICLSLLCFPSLCLCLASNNDAFTRVKITLNLQSVQAFLLQHTPKHSTAF